MPEPGSEVILYHLFDRLPFLRSTRLVGVNQGLASLESFVEGAIDPDLIRDLE